MVGESFETPGLLGALDQVAGAMSTDETRYALNGVNLDLRTGAVVATDGHRMHAATIPPVSSAAKPIIISRPAVSAVVSPAFRSC